MFEFNLDRSIPLLTITRSGFWTLETVAAYEIELRLQLAELRRHSPRASCIIDIRSRGVQSIDVANALQVVVGRLGILIAARTAVVAHSGLAKLQGQTGVG